jgi:hypothetical protein
LVAYTATTLRARAGRVNAKSFGGACSWLVGVIAAAVGLDRGARGARPRRHLPATAATITMG